MLKSLLSLAVTAVLLMAVAQAEETANGAVFEDMNRNGARDADEAGVPEVCVSNGRDVVQTNAEGLWSLPVGDDTALFVIKPRGWMVPVNEDQIPQHYYLHKPKGSPPLNPPGMAPTGPLPESIDFPLYRYEESNRFDMVLFGDTQARGLREVNFVSHDVVEELIGSEAAFGMSLGDIVADDVQLFQEINESIAQIGIPWYNVFGNHDNDRGAKENRHYDEHFERVYGPSTYAFEYGNVVFLPLNDVYFKDDGKYTCRFTEDQLAFIANYLALVPKDRLIVTSMHIPYVRCENGRELFEILAQFPNTLALSAHAHEQMQFFLGKDQGWPGGTPHHVLVHATVCGSWWCGTFDELGIPHATMNDGAPNGYSIVSFDENQYTVRFKAARRPADYQMNLYLPDDLRQAEAENTNLLVNIFAGSEKSTVEMQFGVDGAWTPMTQTETIDPEVLRMHEQNPHLNETVFGWKMDYPSRSRHFWQGKLPAAPPVGTHLVTVRTTDMYGQTWTGRRILRIREDAWVAPEFE